MALRVVSMQVAGQTPIHEASCNSLFSGELAQRVAATGLELFGMNGQAAAAAASLSRNAQKFYLRTTTSTVRGGTKEIQRNVIATRGLGLPRE
jgi:alkylation response protein AidB-like acyl-CoA dehydrogenase